MGWFTKRRAGMGEAPDYAPIALLGWDETRTLSNLDVGSVASRSGQTLAAAALAQACEPAAVLARPDVAIHLQTLIPGLQSLGGFPANPDDVATDFVAGWVVADEEDRLGLSRPGMTSSAAQFAMMMLRLATEEAAHGAAAVRFLDYGYCCNCLKLAPAQALQQACRRS